ncbi:hypothetical protein JCM18750_37350 [Halostagnicola bangensis]
MSFVIGYVLASVRDIFTFRVFTASSRKFAELGYYCENSTAGDIRLDHSYISMGFGSYDESEQQHQNKDTEDNEDAAVNVHEHEHEGTMTVETGGSTDDLLGQLQDIKEKKEHDE